MRNKHILALIAASICIVGCQNTTTPETSKNNSIEDSIEQATESKAKETDNANGSAMDEEQGAPQDECFEKSEYNLPHNRTINPKKATYKILPCEVEGVEEFLCNSRGLRYIPLPDYKNVDVILVPMDCGDFNYRYLLLTVVNKRVVANQYVEGEWYEPGDDTYKEITTFTIDKNYLITVTTNSIENNKTSLKERVELQIMDDGVLKKI